MKLRGMVKELTKMESAIIKEIAKAYPFTEQQVKYVYSNCRSFDDTIKILELTTSFGTEIDHVVSIFNSI